MSTRRRSGSARTMALAVALGVACLGCPFRPPAAPAPAPLSEPAILDSLRAAVAAGQPERALYWAERRRALAPAEPLHMIGHAMALHDFVRRGPTGGRVPAALRTSLQRIGTDLRVMAILDSAGRAATDARTRSIAAHLLGTQLESYGLAVDALPVYTRAFAAAGDDTMLAGRINHLMGMLRAPQKATGVAGRTPRARAR